MTPPLFVCARDQLDSDTIVLGGDEGRHATTVRRIGPGERVDVTDGSGLVAECMVTASGAGELRLAVRARRSEPEPACRVVVAQAIVKGDRGELAVELMTEVGVDVIVPWAAERCSARWLPEREERALDRWRSAARQAAKQSRRARFPEVTRQRQTPGVAALVSGAARAVLLDHGASLPLAEAPLPGEGEIVLVVGPEGGISESEAATLTAAGAVSARLGPTVLRGSTAGAVAGAILLSRSGRWS